MKVYYDVTQLVHHQGSITGIPRVMHELAIRFMEDDRFPDVSYVSWVKDRQQMLYVDYDESVKNRNGIKYTNKEKKNLQIENKTSEQESAKQNIHEKTSLQKLLKRIHTKLSSVSPRAGHFIERFRADIVYSKYEGIQPGKGDILFIGHGEWWDENFIDYVLNLAKEGVQIVQIVHDFLPIFDPQFSGHSTESLQKYSEKVLPVSSLVLTVSEHTKKDVVRWLKQKNLPQPKIEFFRLGDDFKYTKPKKPVLNSLQSSVIKNDNFILCVGTLEARKNFMIMYYALKLSIERGQDIPAIVHVGRRGWKTENIYDIITEDPAVQKKMFIMGGVSDEELAWYYQNCLALSHPSFGEGWGLQIAESAFWKKPAIVSKTTSMPEVIGEFAAEYVSPYSSDEVLNAIIRVSDKKRNDSVRKKLEKYSPFTWDESFNQIKEYIREFQ